jgi:hypothetical protein
MKGGETMTTNEQHYDVLKQYTTMSETQREVRRVLYDAGLTVIESSESRAANTLRMIQCDWPIENLRSWHNEYRDGGDYDWFADLFVTANLYDHYDAIRRDRFGREFVTKLALDDSLCPMHFVDYCGCFDDDDPACRTIREIHPSHDT